MAKAGLSWLASADIESMPTGVQADCLRELERTLAVHTAARARVVSAFTAQAGYERDGQCSPRTWLTWQTRVTRGAASAVLACARRLRAHPAVAGALSDGAISESWARQITDWTDLLPAGDRADADAILLAAAAGGAELPDLALLAEEMRRRLAHPDRDGREFDERSLRLATTLGGAGKLYGDLTPRCAAAVQAVIDALGKRAGPEDIRSLGQRQHDALEEAARRLLAAGCLPDRAGQPTQLQLHITLDELLRRFEGGPAQRDEPAVPGAIPPGAIPPGAVLQGAAAAAGDECDAAIAPVVTGRVDHDLLDKLARQLPRLLARAGGPATPGQPAQAAPPGSPAAQPSLSAAAELILANAVALLSGPGGLASVLRTGTLAGPAASISLPLDVGAVTDTIPPHLRRAVILRDKHCAAAGCDQPPAACQVHHLRPRSKGGATKLTGLVLLCSFHHLILVHEWGWTISLNADGTTTMSNPDGSWVRHSHGPPATAA